MTESNEREYARLTGLLRNVMERAERSSTGDHAVLELSWGSRGSGQPVMIRGKLRGPIELFAECP